MKKYLWVVALSFLVLLVDLVAKSWAMTTFREVDWTPVSWFELTYSENAGIAFGIPWGGMGLIVASVILIVILGWYAVTVLDLNRLSVKMMTSLVLGGALGNLYDRIVYGVVRDFIGIGPWPTFNIADAAIVVGVLSLLTHLLKTSHESKRN